MGSRLYRRQIVDSGDALMQRVWADTPFMTDAYTGGINTERWRDVMSWCRDTFGDEAWPIHGKPGLWYSGGATVNGWTWMGFNTEEMMRQFQEQWCMDEEAASDG